MQFGARHRHTAIILVVAGIIFAACIQHQRWIYKDWHQGSGKYIQRIHLPDEEVIKIAALGYDNLYADFLTLRAIQMFGAAWDTETGETKPIYDYFDILTSLDPRFIDVYELSHLVLSDDHGAHDQALDLLRKGIRENKKAVEEARAEGRELDRDWRLPYLGLYTAAWHSKEPEVAREFLAELKEIPTAPEHILRMEEYIERQSGKFHAAYDINLKNFINYSSLNMEVETQIALDKFSFILDGWYKLELARAADAYRKAKGKHPESLEDLLREEEFIPRFQAPTLQSLKLAIEYYESQPGSLNTYAENIRELAMQEITGIPPEPAGTWYYIDPGIRNRVIDEEGKSGVAPEDDDRPLVERYPYILPAGDVFEGLNMISLDAQGVIVQKHRETGSYPDATDISEYLGPDYFGGHFVYITENTPDGFPRYFSTTQIRRMLNKDPRMGLQGTLEDFPKRQYMVSDALPPYLTTLPTIWDFEEDAQWALCFGLQPGVDTQAKALDNVLAVEQYQQCNSHIGVPVELEK